MELEKVHEHLLASLEHEKGGVLVYETALKCATNEELMKEWEEYLDQTRRHVEILEKVCSDLNINTNQDIPTLKIVRHLGNSLVQAMEMALGSGDKDAAEIVAAECVVLAETKDHANWELIGQVAEKSKGQERKILKEAYDEVEEEEDEHLYHTIGWARELHINAFGLPAVLPPPEEEKDVKTAIGAERAKNARKDML